MRSRPPRLRIHRSRCAAVMAERARHALDTSFILAALLGWHERHASALRVLQNVFERFQVVVPGPALIEAYSVMTRLPSPHRLGPSDARALLEENFEQQASVVALTSIELWRFVRALPQAEIAGGRSYDAHILACADKAHASVLWTLNERDFLAVGHPDIEIKSPSDERTK